MGKIVPFPMPAGALHRLNRRKKAQKPKRETVRVLKDLCGTRPIGHPRLKRGPRGKVLVALNQVWMEIHNDQLYVITGMSEYRPSVFRLRMSPYADPNKTDRYLSEITLRLTMIVWDKAEDFINGLMDKFRDMARKEGIDEESALEFFGLDPDGNRIR